MAEQWQSLSSLPPLPPGELQLWRVDLPATPIPCDHLLSPEELARAQRLRVPHVHQQFTVARAALRTLLGINLERPPREVPIVLSPYGKPEIPGNPIYFNLAHSRSTILIALCRDSPVGIDLEYLDRDTDILEVARTSFTPAESRQIALLPVPDDRHRAFFHCWTRKEAVVKADGRGLSLPLTAFEVPVIAVADRTPVLIDAASGILPSRSTLFVTSLELGNDLSDNIAAAFATGSPAIQPRTLSFPLAALHFGMAAG